MNDVVLLEHGSGANKTRELISVSIKKAQMKQTYNSKY